jgi:hypothetical protein
MTPGQLAAAMPDVAQATLYRHINRLWAGGIIEITAEQVVNGATERTYAVTAGQGQLTDADLAGLSPEEHTRYFATFTASLIEAFSRYVQAADPTTDPLAIRADGLSYNRAAIYLNAAEQAEFQEAVMALIQGVLSNPPTPERRRYTLASVVIPDERNPST